MTKAGPGGPLRGGIQQQRSDGAAADGGGGGAGDHEEGGGPGPGHAGTGGRRWVDVLGLGMDRRAGRVLVAEAASRRVLVAEGNSEPHSDDGAHREGSTDLPGGMEHILSSVESGILAGE